jgi:hypothetical protein
MVPRQVASIEEASALASFEVVLPAAIPAGFTLRSIEYARPPFGGPNAPKVHNDWVTARYMNAEGRSLVVSQGFPALLSGLYDIAPENQRGTVSIGTHSGTWVTGMPGPGAPVARNGRQVPPTWEAGGGVIVAWIVDRVGDAWERKPSGEVAVGSPLSYSIASNALSLDELVTIAASVPAGR